MHRDKNGLPVLDWNHRPGCSPGYVLENFDPMEVKGGTGDEEDDKAKACVHAAVKVSESGIASIHLDVRS
jgi:hypothetical protein